MDGLRSIKKHYPAIAGRVIGLDKLGEERAAEVWQEIANDMLCALETEKGMREFAANHPERAFTVFKETCDSSDLPCFCIGCRGYGD